MATALCCSTVVAALWLAQSLLLLSDLHVSFIMNVSDKIACLADSILLLCMAEIIGYVACQSCMYFVKMTLYVALHSTG